MYEITHIGKEILKQLKSNQRRPSHSLKRAQIQQKDRSNTIQFSKQIKYMPSSEQNCNQVLWETNQPSAKYMEISSTYEVLN